MLKMLKILKALVNKKVKEINHRRREKEVIKKCMCICICPSCGDILNDQAECIDTDLVRYTCRCGHKSGFNFDICPIPILVEGRLGGDE